VDASQLKEAVFEEIKAISLGGPKAIMETKKLVRQMCNIDSEQAFEIATEWSVRMFQSEEGVEGINAFREKRKPNWQ
jgi:methylglutaconyl-CoA hydratase